MQQDIESRIESVVQAALANRLDEIRQELTELLRAECGALVESRIEEHEAATAQTARRETAESLAEGVRRIRSAESVTGIAGALVETAAEFAGRCALFIHKGERLLGFRMSGQEEGQGDEGQGDEGQGEEQSSFESMEVPLAGAAALAHAVETRDAVVAGGNPGELSEDVVHLFGLTADDRVHLFPIVLRDKVLAVLYADAGNSGRDVERAAIEILTSVAEAWLEAVGTRKKPVLAREEAAV